MNRSISRVLAAAVASAGFAAPIPTFSATLSCTSSSFSAAPDGSGNIVVNCTQAGGGTAPPPSCYVSASPTVLSAAGGNVTLTASNCGTVSGWTGGKAATGGTSSSWQDTIPANTGTQSVTYSYTVSGSSGSASVGVTVQAAGSTTTNGGAISCNGYGKTVVVDLAWGALKSGNVRVNSSGFGNGAILVARFTTPSTTAPSLIGKIQAAESSGGPIPRSAALSTTPCDFPSPPLAKFSTVPNSTSPTASYVVGGTSAYYAILSPSTTYYFNIKNEVNGAPTCSGNCDMFVELQKPSGL